LARRVGIAAQSLGHPFRLGDRGGRAAHPGGRAHYGVGRGFGNCPRKRGNFTADAPLGPWRRIAMRYDRSATTFFAAIASF
jgi:hypothetical protein